jgi:hypothetical protein
VDSTIGVSAPFDPTPLEMLTDDAGLGAHKSCGTACGRRSHCVLIAPTIVTTPVAVNPAG